MLVEDDIFEIESKVEDNDLGGDNFTQVLVDHCCNAYKGQTGVDV